MKSILSLFLFFSFCLIEYSFAQGTYNMCTGSFTTDTSGTLYDSGGLNGSYQGNQSCTLLVSPPCALSITITFTQFATESGYDFLQIWDGTSTSGTQLLNASGSVIPPTLTCNSGSMYIIWNSDFTTNDLGFAAAWTSVNAGIPPIASFSISDTTPAFGQAVHFADSTTNQPFVWFWNFGDGDTSHLQYPDHAYNAPGSFTVTLIASNCVGTDTAVGTVTVSCAPSISVAPSSFFATAHCDSSVDFTIQIINHSACEAIYNITTDRALGQTVSLLAMTYGSDPFSEFPHTIAAINSHFTNYVLTQTSSTSPSVLAAYLIDKEVLLIPENETGSASNWLPLAPVIQDFLSSGGSVVWCGSFGSLSQSMFNTGVWTGAYDSSAFTSVNVDLPLHPLAAGLSPVFTPPSSTFPMLFTNPDKVTIASRQSGDIIAYRNHNGGKAIFVAFDYFSSNLNSDHAIANAIEWGGADVPTSWIHITPDSGSVSGFDTTTIHVSFSTVGLPEGVYTSQIQIQTNDSLHPSIMIPCTLVISDMEVLVPDTCLDFAIVNVHDTVIQNLELRNTGCDTIYISSTTFNLPEFSLANIPPAYILPGDTAIFEIAFYSDSIGIFNGDFQLINSYRDTNICMTAEAIDTATAVKNLSTEKYFSIFPNPSSDKIVLKSEKFQNAVLKILNMKGEFLMQVSLKEEITVLGIENLPAGVYFFKLETENGVIVKELVKIE